MSNWFWSCGTLRRKRRNRSYAAAWFERGLSLFDIFSAGHYASYAARASGGRGHVDELFPVEHVRVPCTLHSLHATVLLCVLGYIVVNTKHIQVRNNIMHYTFVVATATVYSKAVAASNLRMPNDSTGL